MNDTRQDDLDKWKAISRRIYASDKWEYIGHLSSQREELDKKHKFSLMEKKTGKAVGMKI
jgi:hypothetical protein